MSTVEVIEVRCPAGPARLFTKLGLGQIPHRYIQPENWIEFQCSDCAKAYQRERAMRVRVLHRYNFAGELVQTLITEREASPDDR